MSWTVEYAGKKPELKNPVLICGLPGIGNVGKIAVDFFKEELKSKKILEFSSCELPHTVFVNEKNLIELPSIQLYSIKTQNRDILLLVGDAQPINESACYDFCEKVVSILKESNCKEVITVGGIALRHIPKKPNVYCIGANKDNINSFVKGAKISTQLYGVVGPIIGVTGVLSALASKRGLFSVILLAETYGHPMFLGIAGAKEILQVLCQKFGIKVKLDSLEKEMTELEEEMLVNRKDISDVQNKTMAKLRHKFGNETSYIG